MFFAFFGKKNQEESKIQELERTIQELTTELDSLKRIISEMEKKAEEKCSFPNSLVPSLPFAGVINITSYGNERYSYGEPYFFGVENLFVNKPYVQYEVEVKSDAYLVFEKSYHPFIKKYASDLKTSTQYMKEDFRGTPFRFGITQDVLCILFRYGYYDVSYKETQNYVMYKEMYHESYHDGGGSGKRVWYLYAAPGKNEAQELAHIRNIGGCTIPACKGYWFEDEHLYLVEPWDIPGIFEYYYCSITRRDYDSDDECRKIGVKYPEKGES